MSSKLPIIRVSVISGFLGSGKTTLLNRILNGDHGLKIAVMVNDFGEINIDANLIVSASQNITSLANGCICCTVESDLIEQLEKLCKMQEGRPEHILIETSGVSDPGRVVHTLRYPQLRQWLVLDTVVVLLDAERHRDLPEEVRPLAQEQLAAADIVVINKVDLVSPESLQELKRQWLFPRAKVHEAVFANIPLPFIFDTSPERFAPFAFHARQPGYVVARPQRHDQLFSSFSWHSSAPLSLAALRKVIGGFPDHVYRAKGFLYLQGYPERRFVLHLVGARLDIQPAATWDEQEAVGSHLVVIGSRQLDAQALCEHLEQSVCHPEVTVTRLAVGSER